MIIKAIQDYILHHSSNRTIIAILANNKCPIFVLDDKIYTQTESEK